jgi:hypothetical protein
MIYYDILGRFSLLLYSFIYCISFKYPYSMFFFDPHLVDLCLHLGSRNSGGAESERGLGAKKSLRRGRKHWA